jgi:hypothetical protein
LFLAKFSWGYGVGNIYLRLGADDFDLFRCVRLPDLVSEFLGAWRVDCLIDFGNVVNVLDHRFDSALGP